jgi:hypothetical protein
MRLFSLAFGTALLAGCTTVADLRQEPAFIQTVTQKSVQAFAACLADQWTARSGTTNSVPRPNGTALTLSYQVYSNTVAAVTVTVDDLGQSRAVSVYARKGDRSDKLRREIDACL